ncbi:hypothetical protein NDI85_07375 [Halomicroarcula sp. S1AR25-4]|uniref:hypothetical protein n=1 Tax=Haloarcula sp. S1AR25-4 TaxID=2950538 RepID=UPI0028744399|nr:hypothetical protein [Halomicroarcula sp. S1AR25-4]MDS0277610.1 hypothetical protein [Halomicroarcula sp. S1AR25-4]
MQAPSVLYLGTIGLALDIAGATLVLVPTLPWLMKRFIRVWPFSKFQHAKEQLYLQGKIERGDEGFHFIKDAVLIGTRPFLSTPRLDEVDGQESRASLDGKDMVSEKPGLRLECVQKSDENALSESVFIAEYSWKAVNEMNEQFPSQLSNAFSPKLKAELPPGELPRHISAHEERLFFRGGAILLVTGFTFQIVSQFV